jgi:hypothetical protein
MASKDGWSRNIHPLRLAKMMGFAKRSIQPTRSVIDYAALSDRFSVQRTAAGHGDTRDTLYHISMAGACRLEETAG